MCSFQGIGMCGANWEEDNQPGPPLQRGTAPKIVPCRTGPPSPFSSPPHCKQHPQPAGGAQGLCPVPTATYPVAAAMTQPPCSGVASTQQPMLSWLMPKLWPISWAIVAAAPMGCSEWSWIGTGDASAQQPGRMKRGDATAGNGVVGVEGPQQPWDCNWVPWEGQREGWRRIRGRNGVWCPKSPAWDCWEALLLEATAENPGPWKEHPKTEKPRCPNSTSLPRNHKSPSPHQEEDKSYLGQR